MEKPHPLSTHAPSSAFLYSTHQQSPAAAQSEVKENSFANQTGQNSAHKKSIFSSFNARFPDVEILGFWTVL